MDDYFKSFYYDNNSQDLYADYINAETPLPPQNTQMRTIYNPQEFFGKNPREPFGKNPREPFGKNPREPFALPQNDEKLFLYFIIIVLICTIVILQTNNSYKLYKMAKKQIKHI